MVRTYLLLLLLVLVNGDIKNSQLLVALISIDHGTLLSIVLRTILWICSSIVYNPSATLLLLVLMVVD